MLLVFCLLTAASLARCDDSSQENFRTAGVYNFNHPPNVDYNPIPVEIIYDEYPYEVKSDDDVITTTAYYEEITEEPEKFTEKDKADNTNTKPELIPKGRSLFEITTQKLAAAFQIQNADTTTEQNIRRKPSRVNLVSRRRQEQPNEPLKYTSTTSTTTVKTFESAQNERISLLPVQETRPNDNKKTREREPVVPIVESENYIYSDKGNFHYSYEGGDGTKAFGQGELRHFDDDTAGEAVSGSFSYTDKDGNDFSLTYTADENGYRPVGAHLPTPPPIPPAIARALKILATKPTDTATEIYY